MQKSIPFFNTLIWYGLLSIAIVTPLLFTTLTTEVFEVPKMFFVYIITAVVFSAFTLKSVLQNKIFYPKNAIFLTLLAFIGTQSLSTLFSIDQFTSIYGYPSRLNGGLISQFIYAALFYVGFCEINKQKAKKLLLVFVFSALFTSIWGIPSHFGKDPTCLVLAKKLTASCWQQEFNPQIRIFSTLGQPNWLASYLVLALPFSLAFLLSSVSKNQKIIFSAVTFVIFLALIFTNSRSGAIGATAALGLFFLLLGKKFFSKNLKIIGPVLIILLVSTLVFGATLFSRIKEFKSPSAPNRGTESSAIRAIVWQGGWEVFKKYPILGSGPETFAYSYFKVRPLSHNQTTEWNFFYNKAHNELINYLANVGALGFSAYLIFLAAVLINLLRAKREVSSITSENLNGELSLRSNNNNDIFSKTAASAIIGYQTTIFFGFSTVAPQTLMFIILPAALILKGFKPEKFDLKWSQPVKTGTFLLTFLFSLFFIAFVLRLTFADLLSQRAKNSPPATGLLNFSDAILVYPSKNPFYMADHANELSTISAQSQEQDIAKEFAFQSQRAITQTINAAPNNLIVMRRLANAYMQIAGSSNVQAKFVGQRVIELAPTDPQSYLTNAKILMVLSKYDDAAHNLEKAIALKPNYVEAKELLDQVNQKRVKDQ